MNPGQPSSVNHSEVIPSQKESGTSSLNQWIYSTIRPYIKGRILEIGSGDGNTAKSLITDGYSLRLSDWSEHFCKTLHQRFEDAPLIKVIYHLDPKHFDFKVQYANLLDMFYTVIVINVSYHDKIDNMSVSNI